MGEEQYKHPLNRLSRSHPGSLADEWVRLCTDDPKRAERLINDPNLEYPALFMLKDTLDSHVLSLAPRPSIALAHTQQVLIGTGDARAISSPSGFIGQHDLIVGSLFWILRTGWKNLHDVDYIRVIDQAAIQILLTWRQDWYKEMVDLIVYRFRNRSQRHYLISALLETANPIYLVHMANYLLSDQSAERLFARAFLSFIPDVRHAPDDKSAFRRFEMWYEDNEHYLVYTGETNDTVPDARPFRIHYSAKYLGKTVDRTTGTFRQRLIDVEVQNYRGFLDLPKKDQMHLSSRSCLLRKEHPEQWQEWIEQPLSHQLKQTGSASSGGGYA